MSSDRGGRSFVRGWGGRNNNHQGRGRGAGTPNYGGHKFAEWQDRRPKDDNEPFVLSAKPSHGESNRWTNNMQAWTAVNCSRHNHQRMLNKEGGPAPQLQELPVKPLRADFESDAVFSAAHKDYTTAEGRAYATNKEILEDNKKLHGQMMKYLSEGFKVNIRGKHGSDIIDNQDPKPLIDAIHSTFLGLSTDKAKNKYDIAVEERKFHAMRQRDGQGIPEYREFFNLSLRNLAYGKFHEQKDQEGALTYDEVYESMYDQKTLANIFTLGLDRHVWQPWFDDYQKGHEKWPKKLDAAYEKFSQLEELYVNNYRANKRRNDRGHNDRDSVPVMAAGASQKKGGKSQSGGWEKPKPEHDTHGKQICNFEKRNGAGSCGYGSKCKFSHEIDHVQKKKPDASAASQCGGGAAGSGNG